MEQGEYEQQPAGHDDQFEAPWDYWIRSARSLGRWMIFSQEQDFPKTSRETFYRSARQAGERRGLITRRNVKGLQDDQIALFWSEKVDEEREKAEQERIFREIFEAKTGKVWKKKE